MNDKNQKTNILFLFDDQHHAGCCGFAGHPLVQTPNLDALAQKGATFNNMFACSAICGPSRTSFFTGAYLRTHGHFYNDGDLMRPFPSMLTELRKAGYASFQSGKNHLPYKVARDFDEMRTMKNYNDEMEDKDIKQVNAESFHQYFMSAPWKKDEDTHRGVWTAQQTIDFLNSEKSKQQPFFAWTSFAPPHSPHVPPESLDKMYDPKDIPVDWEAYEKFERSRMQKRPMMEEFWKVGSVRHDVSIFQKAVCRYLALVTLVDREVGRILEALDEQGLADNTIVIFTADHGDFAGHYGQLGKNLPAYDDLIRIPFIYHDPQKPFHGRVVEDMHQNVDLFPSLMDRLGLETPPTVQGQSFLPALEGRPGSGRDFVFAETSMEKTVRSKDWKLTYFVRHPEKGQLFRMGHNPDETKNLWDDSAYSHIKQSLLSELMAWMVRCEQPDGMCSTWEKYIDTPWYNWLSQQSGEVACQEEKEL